MQWARALERSTIWLSVARSVSGGRAARDYVIYDDAGSPLLGAQTSPWQRDILVQMSGEPFDRVLRLRRRLSFPLTGRVDVYDAAAARLGVVSRSGRYRSASGRDAGRFRDARTLRDVAREGAFSAMMDALLGADGTTAAGTGPSGFVWLVDAQPIGTLGRARLPFGGGAAAAAGPTRRLSVFTSRLRALVAPAAPQGWKLERLQPALAGDPRLVLAAALFAIELSHW